MFGETEVGFGYIHTGLRIWMFDRDDMNRLHYYVKAPSEGVVVVKAAFPMEVSGFSPRHTAKMAGELCGPGLPTIRLWMNCWLFVSLNIWFNTRPRNLNF